MTQGDRKGKVSISKLAFLGSIALISAFSSIVVALIARFLTPGVGTTMAPMGGGAINVYCGSAPARFRCRDTFQYVMDGTTPVAERQRLWSSTQAILRAQDYTRGGETLRCTTQAIQNNKCDNTSTPTTERQRLKVHPSPMAPYAFPPYLQSDSAVVVAVIETVGYGSLTGIDASYGIQPVDPKKSLYAVLLRGTGGEIKAESDWAIYRVNGPNGSPAYSVTQIKTGTRFERCNRDHAYDGIVVADWHGCDGLIEWLGYFAKKENKILRDSELLERPEVDSSIVRRAGLLWTTCAWGCCQFRL